MKIKGTAKISDSDFSQIFENSERTGFHKRLPQMWQALSKQHGTQN